MWFSMFVCMYQKKSLFFYVICMIPQVVKRDEAHVFRSRNVSGRGYTCQTIEEGPFATTPADSNETTPRSAPRESMQGTRVLSRHHRLKKHR